jgi:hypothetical protein
VNPQLQWDAVSTIHHRQSVLFSQKGIEICPIMCDNLPPQIKGFTAFLVTHKCRISGIRCLNHISNLVFSHVIRTCPIREIHERIAELRRLLSSSQGKVALSTHCPKMIVRRWNHQQYVPECIWDNIDSVNPDKAVDGMHLHVEYLMHGPSRTFVQARQKPIEVKA